MASPNLTDEDRQLLEAFRDRLNRDFGEVVDTITVFGSKARGEATEESDLDILVIIDDGDWRLKWSIADAAYELAIGTSVVPSVKIYTRHEWERLRRSRSEFYDSVTRDGFVAA